MTDLNAEELARLCLHDPNNLNIQLSQTKHRIQLLSHFPIHPGSRVLEIGCGQGDCTAVLAELVGDSGHVTAIDPADLTYGMAATSQLPQLTYSRRTIHTRTVPSPPHLLPSRPPHQVRPRRPYRLPQRAARGAPLRCRGARTLHMVLLLSGCDL